VKKYDLILVIPHLNDWPSLEILLKELKILTNKKSIENVLVLIIDDHSFVNVNLNHNESENFEIKIVRLMKNMGHQRAIAIGLCYAFENYESNWIGVMDVDGEDKPEDLFLLYTMALKEDQSVFAKRSKRSEGMIFKLFYLLYKLVFITLTGEKIGFGNFSVIKRNALQSLVIDSNIWNNYAIGFLKSKITFGTLKTERGSRYIGNSKMKFTQLIIHGLSGVSIFADVVTTRIILFSLLVIFSSIIGIGVVISIRLLTDMAIPGWATYSVLGLAILLFQALLTSFFTLFIFLSNRSSLGIKPIKEYKDYIL
jgi:hypothetical protein